MKLLLLFVLSFCTIQEIYPTVLTQKLKIKTLGHLVNFQNINKAISSEKRENFPDTLLKTQEAAIKHGEPFLFKAFGESQVLSEKPYIVTLNAGSWSIKGMLKKRKGGTFLIIMDSVDGRIIKLTHGK